MMKTQKFIFAIVITCFVFTGCKNDTKPVIAKDAKVEQLAMNISGMTCEIGCAKTIQSKLAKKDGVIDAKVIFTDSIATVKYDANKTNKADLMAFVDGIAGGELYKSSEAKDYKMCKADCKKACCANKDKKACKPGCDKKSCDSKEKKACAADCKKACCATDKKA